MLARTKTLCSPTDSWTPPLAAWGDGRCEDAADLNVTGLPAISLPPHWTPDGLSVGIQLVAASGREDVLLRVVSQIELARPSAPKASPLNEYRRWKRLGGYKDTDHHIKFRMSDLQRHLQRKAKDGRASG